MITTTPIQHPKLTVQISTFSEGSSHDPYHVYEIAVTTPSGKTILHEGLATWLKHNNQEFPARADVAYEEHERHLRETLFPRCVGFSIAQLERIARKRRGRCGRCGNKAFRAESGYPGETFEVCCKCGHINASSMDYSAIE